MPRHVHNPIYRSFELVALTIALPVMLYHYMPRGMLLLTLWLTALYCHVIYREIVGVSDRIFWNRQLVTRDAFQPIFVRFALCAIVLTIGTWIYRPDLLFALPRAHPGFWLLILVLYPLISVVPQEIIFRVFFFRRYRKIFPRRAAIVLVSGIAFGLAHVIFHNWVAPIMAAVGGIFFADTYVRRPSLMLVAIEHALYGDFIFTLGLGRYFYEGTLQTLAAHPAVQ